MNSKIIIERDDEHRAPKAPPLPLMSQPDPKHMAAYLTDLQRVYAYAKRKCNFSKLSSAAEVERAEASLRNLFVGFIYLHLLDVVRRVHVAGEDDFVRLLEAGGQGDTSGILAPDGDMSLLQETPQLNVLLKPLAALDIKADMLLMVPWKRLLTFLEEHSFDKLGWDVLGMTYLALKDRSSRKKAGAYHTPPEVARFMVDGIALEEETDPSFVVIDPACGSGVFLLAAVDKLYKLYVDRGMDGPSAWLHAVGTNVLGFDNNPEAVALAQMNFLVRTIGERLVDPPIHIYDPLQIDDDLFTAQSLKQRWHGGAEYIIGNPPWRPLRGGEQTEFQGRFMSAHGRQANLFSLFLEASIRALKPGGRLMFLLPEALLNVQSYEPLRSWMMERVDVTLLAPCGNLWRNVLAPSVVVGLHKHEEEAEKEEPEDVKVVETPLMIKPREECIPYDIFRSFPEKIFNYQYETQLEESCGLIETGGERQYLADNAEWALGIVTGNNSKFIADRKKKDDYDRILVGKDVDRYRIGYSGNWVLYDPYLLQQTAPEELYRVPEKLIYKFIGNRLRFAYDDNQMLTLNNLNILIPNIPGYSMRYVLGLLNSRLLQFYYAYRFFTVKVLRSKLEMLPLALGTAKQVKTMEKLVKGIVQHSDNETKFITLDEEIDSLVFDIYGIDETRRARIKQWLKFRKMY